MIACNTTYSLNLMINAIAILVGLVCFAVALTGLGGPVMAGFAKAGLGCAFIVYFINRVFGPGMDSHEVKASRGR